ncbi:MAG: Lrp/AsnC family transcriptional regulator [Haloferacaceae archaeon]
MVVAYVMVKASTGDAERIKAEMNDVDGVVHTNVVAGDVDFIAKVDVGSPGDVREAVADHVRTIEGVADTQTYIAMD